MVNETIYNTYSNCNDYVKIFRMCELTGKPNNLTESNTGTVIIYTYTKTLNTESKHVRIIIEPSVLNRA